MRSLAVAPVAPYLPPPDELEQCLGPAPTARGSYIDLSHTALAPLAAPACALDAPIATSIQHSRLDYIRGSVASPVSLSFAVFAGCIGMGYAGLLGAAVAVAAVVACGVHAAGYRAVRRFVDEQARVRARQLRDHARLRRLRPTSLGRHQQFYELRLLVEDVERLDPTEAARFELHDLLDHYIDLAVAHQRLGDALRVTGAAALPSCAPMIDPLRSARRRDILQRRIAHRDDCVRRMAQLGDELEAIDDLIRLVVQRAASAPGHAELGRELDRRLCELDEVDAAMRQLS